LRQAAVAIPANIAEGFKAKTNADKARFVNLALGSLEDRRYYLILASELAYWTSTEKMAELEEVSKPLDA